MSKKKSTQADLELRSNYILVGEGGYFQGQEFGISGISWLWGELSAGNIGA